MINGHGAYTVESGLSLSGCKDRCRQEATCTAFEYVSSQSRCELHTESITHGDGADHCTCYIKSNIVSPSPPPPVYGGSPTCNVQQGGDTYIKSALTDTDYTHRTDVLLSIIHSPPSLPPPAPPPPPPQNYRFITSGRCSEYPGYAALTTVDQCMEAALSLWIPGRRRRHIDVGLLGPSLRVHLAFVRQRGAVHPWLQHDDGMQRAWIRGLLLLRPIRTTAFSTAAIAAAATCSNTCSLLLPVLHRCPPIRRGRGRVHWARRPSGKHSQRSGGC